MEGIFWINFSNVLLSFLLFWVVCEIGDFWRLVYVMKFMFLSSCNILRASLIVQIPSGFLHSLPTFLFSIRGLLNFPLSSHLIFFPKHKLSTLILFLYFLWNLKKLFIVRFILNFIIILIRFLSAWFLFFFLNRGVFISVSCIRI